jgi:[ribosomal protein S5]-alanine N-acetyltransferase
MIKLKPILFGEEKSKFILNDYSKMIFDKIQNMYQHNGFKSPWIGYFAVVNDEIVGSCGFKNQPTPNNAVEIAYTTCPEQEGKGYATEMCRQLKNIAFEHDASVVLRAETLKTNLASHRILLKNEFKLLADTVPDPVHGEVLVWEYFQSKNKML